MRTVCDFDLCAKCGNLQSPEPLPPAPFEVVADCRHAATIAGVLRWPFTGWCLPANGVSLCPKYEEALR